MGMGIAQSEQANDELPAHAAPPQSSPPRLRYFCYDIGAHMKLGSDYISTFLTSHHPYDYAKEHIIYPRCNYYREYTGEQIRTRSQRVPFAKTPIGLKPFRPSLLEYHLRESSKNMVDGFPSWTIEPYISRGEELQRIYGTRWLMVSYHDDALVDFVQFDIDRHHPDADVSAQKSVIILNEASRHFGFDVVWTTSPGYIGSDGEVVHGLYAWIRLDRNHFVMDIRSHVHSFLYSIGLDHIAKDHEGAYLTQKKLVRLPGQFNVELADPNAACKIHRHTPLQASLAFQEAWAQTSPMKSEILTSIAPLFAPRNRQRVLTHSSATPPPIAPHGDTFDALLKWGRPIVNKVYPDSTQMSDCVRALVATAEEHLPSVSRTGQDSVLLRQKVEGIVNYLWANTKPEWVGKRRNDNEDATRFEPHAVYIRDNRQVLIDALPDRLRKAGNAILDLLLKYNGRVAATAIHHGKRPHVCTYRNWKRIRDLWGIVTLVEYVKAFGDKGTCKQWGFESVRQQDTESRDQ